MRSHHPTFLLVLLVFGCDDDKDPGISSGGEAVDASGTEAGDDTDEGGGAGSGEGGGSDAGSGGSSGSGDDTGSGTGGDPACETTVVETVPAMGTSDWFYLSPLEVALSTPDPTTQVSLSHGGAPVPGSVRTADDGLRISFTPDAPLSPDTDYALAVSVCSGAVGTSVDFTTSILGTPLACSLEGRSFRADLSSARVVQPGPALGDLLLDQIEQDFLLGVFSETESRLELHAALSESPGAPQDSCLPSIELPTDARWTDPTFELGPADAHLTLGGTVLPVSDLYIRGTFAPDCSYTAGGVWQATLDARALGPLFDDLLGTTDPDEICTALTTFGMLCEVCATDGETYCVELELDQLAGDAMSEPVHCVSQEDCHPSCATSTCSDPTDGECN